MNHSEVASIPNEPVAMWMNKSGSTMTPAAKQRMIEQGALGGEFACAVSTAEDHSIALVLQSDLAAAQDLAERLKQEARIHATEAATQRSTVQEIYQLCSGGKGEPGDWNGAEPVRRLVTDLAAAQEDARNEGDLRYAAEDALRAAQKRIAELEARQTWQPIATAPKETELLVGRYVNEEWRVCQSGFYYDAGINTPDAHEPSYWYWSCDWDSGGVTDDEGPTHWMPLPAPPALTGEQR